VEIAMNYLIRKGEQVRDRSSEKLGYDVDARRPHGRWRRIEVKASRTDRGWMEVDIRKGANVRKRGERSITVTRKDRPNFDEVIEVVRIGSRAGPVIYHYPPKAVRDGTLAVKIVWILRLPRDERNKYLVG
jgi:hypothetical protein